MQKIEIVIRPDSLSAVTEALRKVKVSCLRISEVTVFDPSASPSGSFRGASYDLGRERLELGLIVADHEVEQTVEAVREGVRNGLDVFELGPDDAEVVVLAVQEYGRLTAPRATRPRSTR
jgi:nitrogen regulatory protein PII